MFLFFLHYAEHTEEGREWKDKLDIQTMWFNLLE